MAKQKTSLLESLYRQTEHTDSILIRDTVAQDGRPLLKSLVCGCVCHFSVHLFLFESSPEDWSRWLPTDQTKRLIFHDCYSDPLGWNNDDVIPKEGGAPNSGILADCSLKRYLDQLEGGGQEERVIVFDCLSPLLLHHSGSAVCRLLHGLGRHCSLVMSLVHADLQEDHVISQLGHVISTNIVMQCFPPTTGNDVSDNYHMCYIQHKKKSGKLLKQNEVFSISPSFYELSSSLFDVHQTMPAPHSSPPSQADPTANLTFDLKLTTKEKQDRANVVLPYTHPQVGVASVGQIFYQPDDADDFDESDPDDDLDI